MLKHVYINGKRIPVPIPVLVLDEALDWVEHTLVPEGHTMTRVTIDGCILGGDLEDNDTTGQMPLTPRSRLEVQVDSPTDLAIQTLEAMRNLCSVVGGGLKPLAVACWKTKPVARPLQLDANLSDCELILDLSDHLVGLLDKSAQETAAVQALTGMLNRHLTALRMAIANSDWRGVAKVLLNKIESTMVELENECETLQIRIMAAGNDNHYAKASTE